MNPVRKDGALTSVLPQGDGIFCASSQPNVAGLPAGRQGFQQGK
jgi:hypothetical protein